MWKLPRFLSLLMLLWLSGFQAAAQEIPLEMAETLGRGTIDSAALSAAGDRLAAAGNQGIWIYDLQFNDIAHLETENARFVAWSSDDRYLAALTEDGRAFVWDMRDYRLRAEVVFPEGVTAPSYHLMRWRPESHLLSFGYTAEVLLWDVDSQAFLAAMPAVTNVPKTDMAWSPNGRNLAIASGGVLRIWDSALGIFWWRDYVINKDRDAAYEVMHLAWSPDAQRIAVAKDRSALGGASKNVLSVVNLATDEVDLVLQAMNASAVAWSPDGTMIAAAGALGWLPDVPVTVWDARNGRLIAQYSGHIRATHSLQWHPSGAQLLSAAYDNTARLWPIEPDTPPDIYRRDVPVLRGHLGRVDALAWTPDSAQLAVGSQDGSVRVWDIATGELLVTNYATDIYGIQALAYSPDGNYLAVGGGENKVHVRGLTDAAGVISGAYAHGQSSIPGSGNPVGITALAWRPDSTMLASTAYDAQVMLWDSDGMSIPRVLQKGGWYALSLYWLRGGELLHIGKWGPETWDVAAGERVPAPCEADSITVAISPDERYYAQTDMMNGGVHLCDAVTGERGAYVGNLLAWNPVYPLAVGTHHAVNTHLIVYDPLTADFRQDDLTQLAIDSPARVAVWSLDGRYLAVGLTGGEVLVWRLAE